MMNTMYLLTGAAGFLGSHICDVLLERVEQVRALVLPGDKSVKYVPDAVEIIEGDLCDMTSLDAFFTVPEGTQTIVIHCASMVTTNADFSQKLLDINVGGTKNIIEQCLNHPECQKMVYVSSTGAIPELPKGQKIKEVDQFDAESDRVVGWYSKSKAMATQAVLDAVRERGLNACVVHPSGILGPKDYAIGETTGTVIKIMNGEMPIGMGGSFNLCDVRDLADGCVSAADKGRCGECYILGNKEVTMKEMCHLLHDASGCKTPYFYVPLGMAYKLAEQMEKKAEKTGEKPLMTNFAVYNLARNNQFDYSKAERELGYHTRPYADTLRDEAQWLAAGGYLAS
ncbi:MAG: NAD-dependent epimerase/dehydratase family protein [Clostridiales bacterium]|nr:NAD-dependent epimerase/dehydratase family protein [Clostridiales bacterium]